MKKLINSFSYALRGLKVLALAERNFKLELAIASLVVFIALFLRLSFLEWGLVILAISLVFLAELFNTAIEKTLDFIHPQRSEKIRDIKDLSAGAVLVSAFFAFCIGLIILLPKIFIYLNLA